MSKDTKTIPHTTDQWFQLPPVTAEEHGLIQQIAQMKADDARRRRAYRHQAWTRVHWPGDLTHTQLRVLKVLWEDWRHGDGGNSWRSFKALAETIRRSEPQTRQAVYDLRDRGILEYSWAVNGDHQPAGSGYFLTYDYDF